MEIYTGLSLYNCLQNWDTGRRKERGALHLSMSVQLTEQKQRKDAESS